MRQGQRAVPLLLAGFVMLAGCSDEGASASRAREVRSIPAPDAEVFLTLRATPAETDALRTVIRRSPMVDTFTYLTRADALRLFRQLFADQPELVATTTADQLPASFPVTLHDPGDRERFARTLERRAGVDEVRTTRGPDCSELRDEIRRMRPPDEVEVFMVFTASETQVAGVRSAIDASPLVRSYEFLSQADAYREFRRLFADKPKLIAGTTPDQLPVSFRVRVNRVGDREQFANAMTGLAGVDEVMANDVFSDALNVMLQSCRPV
jgi:cell division protein FtsX